MCAVWLSNILKTDFFKGKPVVGEKEKKLSGKRRKKKKTVVVKTEKKIKLQFVIGKINK